MIKFKYSEVLSWLRGQIAQGVYKEGDRLPTEGDLTRDFNVSRDTVRNTKGVKIG